MRTLIIKTLLHWMTHNGCWLPSTIVVCVTWESAVRRFMAELDVPIKVQSDPKLSDCDVKILG